MEKLQGTVISTIFRNEENSYTVLSIRSGSHERTVTGIMPELVQGQQVAFTGDWTEHSTYGSQFRAESFEIMQPTTVLGIERYLASAGIKNCGKKTAKQIAEFFGEEALNVLSEHPERLLEMPRMNARRARQIAESFHEKQGARLAMVFLRKYGVTPKLAQMISKKYGEQTEQVVRQNPYRLCEQVEGVGFLTADRIAASIGGIPPESASRIRSAMIFTLKQAALGSGHIYLPRNELVHRTALMLRLDDELCENEIEQMCFDQLIVIERQDEMQRVYLPGFLAAEKDVCGRLVDLMLAFGKTDPVSTQQDLILFEKKNGITFGAQQRLAIMKALTHGVLVITGGPGTGKTTIINCIVSMLGGSDKVSLCAPTGRAAKRMSEATGCQAKTIHRLLEYGGEGSVGFNRNDENPIETKCVIVDETSMVDLLLMRALLRAVESGTRLILVGDADQLPSVGAGNVLGDILASGVVPQVRLTDIYRQSESSHIVLNAHRINHGEMPLLNKGSDFFFERKESFHDAALDVVGLMTDRLPRFMKYRGVGEVMRGIQVLAAAKKGECGVLMLNQLLQGTLNPDAPGKPWIERGDTIFRLGDKVIQTKNDYQMEWHRGEEESTGVFNGDIGYVVAVDTEEHAMTVRFEDDKEAEYKNAADLENLQLAYCLSVHKSQGSEFPVVIMPVVGGPKMLLTRNLFYTALTRARSLVVLVGREEIVREMVENDHILRRYTTLTQRLQETAARYGGEWS